MISQLGSMVGRWNNRQILMALLAMGFLVYGNSLFHPFVHDDVVFIQQNPFLADMDPRVIFRQTAFFDPDFPIVNRYYRPLLEVYYRLVYRFVGLNPHGYHFFNVLIHIANSFLVFLCLGRTFKNVKLPAFLASLLFLIHPVQTEAVACISGISNLLFTLFTLVSFLIYTHARHHRHAGKRFAWHLCALFAFVLALLAKEHAVVLPVLIVLYELYSDNILRRSQREVFRGSAAFVAVALCYLGYRKFMFGSLVSDFFIQRSEFWLRMLAAPESFLTYLKLILFPVGLHYYRSIDILRAGFGPLAGVVLLAVVFFILLFRMDAKRSAHVQFGVLWFLAAILPTLNVVPLVIEYSFLMNAEHFVYLSMAGILFALIALAGFIFERIRLPRKGSVLTAAAIILCAVFSVMTVLQNRMWRGEIPLFQRTLKYENLGRVHILLAKAYYRDKRYTDALEQYRKSLEIMKGYQVKIKDQSPEVRDFYQRFVDEIIKEMAYTYEALGRHEEAEGYYRYALKKFPQEGALHNYYALNQLRLGHLQEAIQHFEIAREIHPSNLMIANSLAVCYIEAGRLKKAERLLQFIVERDPQSLSARQNLKNLREKINKAP